MGDFFYSFVIYDKTEIPQFSLDMSTFEGRNLRNDSNIDV